MKKTRLFSYPFVEARHKGGKQKPTAISIRTSTTTSDDGAALGIANRLHQSNAPQLSYHYVVDELNVYQCVPDNVIALHNEDETKGSISVLVCATLKELPEEWHESGPASTLNRAAHVVAQICHAHKIPPRYLYPCNESRWKQWRKLSRGGIIVTVDGFWPYSGFRTMVDLHLASIKNAKH